MNSQLFYFLNVVFAILFLVWFLSSRGQKSTKLRMKPESPSSSSEALESKSTQRSRQPVKNEPRPVSPQIEENLPQMSVAPEGKNLQVFFLYNGHDWDAYAVLGLPAGTSLPFVTERYQTLIRNGDAGQLQFFEAAYQSILKKR